MRKKSEKKKHQFPPLLIFSFHLICHTWIRTCNRVLERMKRLIVQLPFNSNSCSDNSVWMLFTPLAGLSLIWMCVCVCKNFVTAKGHSHLNIRLEFNDFNFKVQISHTFHMLKTNNIIFSLSFQSFRNDKAFIIITFIGQSKHFNWLLKTI